VRYSRAIKARSQKTKLIESLLNHKLQNATTIEAKPRYTT